MFFYLKPIFFTVQEKKKNYIKLCLEEKKQTPKNKRQKEVRTEHESAKETQL